MWRGRPPTAIAALFLLHSEVRQHSSVPRGHLVNIIHKDSDRTTSIPFARTIKCSHKKAVADIWMHLRYFGADGISLSVRGQRVHGEQQVAQMFRSNPGFPLVSEAWMAADPPRLSLWQTDVAQGPRDLVASSCLRLRLRLRGQTGTLLRSPGVAVLVVLDALLKGRLPSLPRFPVSRSCGENSKHSLINPDRRQKQPWQTAVLS